MRIEIQIIPDPERGTYTLALVVMMEGENGWQPDSQTDPMVLQVGYRTPSEALAALFQTLTFAPPDFAPLEEGLAHISGLIDRMAEVEQAITTVGQRLNDAEESLEQLKIPFPPAANTPRTLLPPRPGKTAAAVQAAQTPAVVHTPPPAIRQPSRVFNVGHGSHAGAITGGVGRRGDLEPTG